MDKIKQVYESVDSVIEKFKEDTAIESMLDIFYGLFETQFECNLARDYARELGYNI